MKKFIVLISVICSANLYAAFIDFESPFPDRLLPMNTYFSGNPVPEISKITDQYSDLGIVFSNAVLVPLGYGHAPSGQYGIGSIDSNGNLDYGTPITVSFVYPTDGVTPGVTNSFSLVTDMIGGTGNTVSISAYSLDGSFVGSVGRPEGTGGETFEISNIGNFHSLVIDSSYGIGGGVALDMFNYGVITPEPATLSLLALGGLLLRRRKKA
jgi:hypothetical protein